jgi:phenylacetate-coenzyme A ligase PaaK-like adenylate-forming protein
MSAFATLRERARAESAVRLPECLARMRWGAPQLAELQVARLRALLREAAERSPFYARRLRGLDPARVELGDLARIPPVSKAELMSELDSVFTDRRLSRALAEDAVAATRTEPVPLLDAYFVQATGGSSGQRGVFVSDLGCSAEVTAGALRHIVARAAARGGLPVPLVVGTVASASPVHATGLAAAMNPHGSRPAEIVAAPVTLPLAEIVARLNEAQPHVLLGYPTVLARLACECATGRLSIAPRIVATTSEMLTPEARAAIRAGLGAPIVDVFGSTEGLMGGTDPDGEVFAFNSDTCIAELVDADDRPVPTGTPSARVLLTNLANRIQPLIRYQLEDSFTRPTRPTGHLRATACAAPTRCCAGARSTSTRW